MNDNELLHSMLELAKQLADSNTKKIMVANIANAINAGNRGYWKDVEIIASDMNFDDLIEL